MSETNKAIYALSQDQQAALADFRQDVVAAQNSTQPCDTDRVASALSSLYVAAGKEPPIVFRCNSPTELVLMPLVLEACLNADLAAAIVDVLGRELVGKLLDELDTGQNKKSFFQYHYRFRSAHAGSLRDCALRQLWLFCRLNGVFESTITADVEFQYGRHILSGARQFIHNELVDFLRRSAFQRRDAIELHVAQELNHLLDLRRVGCQIQPEPTATRRGRADGWLPLNAVHIRELVNSNVLCNSPEPLSTGLAVHLSFYSMSYGWSYMSHIANYVYACEHLSPKIFRSSDRRSLRLWWQIALECWAFICQESVCFVCERPVALHSDDQSRLHHADEAALVFADGSKVYALHGMALAAQIIEHPQLITVRQIEEETNAELRRVLIERYGVAKYLFAAGATKIHEDSFGTLYRKALPNDEPLVMVKVVNSTPEPDGSLKDYFLRVPPRIQTAREAVAWTFGVDSCSYAPLIET